MSDFNQDDIDKLLQEALAGNGDDASSAAPNPSAELAGAASQDDIDALFAAVGEAGGTPSQADPKPEEREEEAKRSGKTSAPDTDTTGETDQNEIDALFAAAASGPGPEENSDGTANQDDIDELFSAIGSGDAAKPPPTESIPEIRDDTETVVQDEPESESEPEPELEPDGGKETATREDSSDASDELESLLSALADEKGTRNGDDDSEADETEYPDNGAGTKRVDDFDMEELLRQVNEAAPPPPRRPTTDDAEPPPRAPAPVPPPSAPPAYAPPPPAHSPPPGTDSGQPREFSVLHGAGEVESLANQIGTLIATLSEKAHRYMQAWMTADGEARELRSRALSEERRRASITSERDVLARELDELRARIGELEGNNVAAEESKRTLETAHQAKVRELESRVKMLGAEADGLKDELTRTRNQATGVDIESRRARFEVDRLKNEVESERMERLRIQRALENREKEIQAVQAQAAGQASSLFIDELHRLVRRLERELETRSSGAHEALKQLDRLETSGDMVPVLSNIRAALMQAVGAESDGDDALKALGREASGVMGAKAVAPEKTEMLSFETALATYNLSGAMDIAGALLRGAKARPPVLMRKMYQCPALRRAEVGDHLDDLARLLEGLRTIQESNDRSRGSETGESEVFHVQMFDFLHNLVRMKLVNRLSGDMWRLFLDLRGRFSFVTSDKQWAEYRDKTLNDNKGA